MNFFGASTIGPGHVRLGSVNQDFWLAGDLTAEMGNDISFLVVSDGVGSKVNSHIGSKATCLALPITCKEYFASGNIVIDAEDFLRLFHEKRTLEILNIADAKQNDQFVDTCSSTCLFAIFTERSLFMGKYGDGLIAAISGNLKDDILLEDNKEDSFSNITHALNKEFLFDIWHTVTVSSLDYDAVVIATDGVSEDVKTGKRIAFARGFYEAYKDIDSGEASNETAEILENWATPLHIDDKTLTCIYTVGS